MEMDGSHDYSKDAGRQILIDMMSKLTKEIHIVGEKMDQLKNKVNE